MGRFDSYRVCFVTLTREICNMSRTIAEINDDVEQAERRLRHASYVGAHGHVAKLIMLLHEKVDVLAAQTAPDPFRMPTTGPR